MMCRKRQFASPGDVIGVHSVGRGKTWALKYSAGMDKGRSRGVFTRVELFNDDQYRGANVVGQTILYLE
jgi:hypothetical protein